MAARKKKKDHGGAFMSKLKNVGNAEDAGREGESDDSKQSQRSRQSKQTGDSGSLQSKQSKPGKPSKGASGSTASEAGEAPRADASPSTRSRGEKREGPNRRSGAGMRRRERGAGARQPSPLAVRTEPYVKEDFKDLAKRVQALSTLEFGSDPTQGLVMEAMVTMIKEEVEEQGISHRLFDYIETWSE